MMFIRDGYNEKYTQNTMSIGGIFTDRNLDADEFQDATGQAFVTNRRVDYAEKVTKAGKIFYRYNVITPLNHGLARQNKPIASGIPIQLTFQRARAEKSLIQITAKDDGDNAIVYTEKTVPIIDPTLSCYFVESVKIENFYAKTKMYDVSLDFLEYSVRRELLIESVSEYKLKLFEGKILL